MHTMYHLSSDIQVILFIWFTGTCRSSIEPTNQIPIEKHNLDQKRKAAFTTSHQPITTAELKKGKTKKPAAFPKQHLGMQPEPEPRNVIGLGILPDLPYRLPIEAAGSEAHRLTECVVAVGILLSDLARMDIAPRRMKAAGA